MPDKKIPGQGSGSNKIEKGQGGWTGKEIYRNGGEINRGGFEKAKNQSDGGNSKPGDNDITSWTGPMNKPKK